jgi:iron complex outermembrane recepter protein
MRNQLMVRLPMIAICLTSTGAIAEEAPIPTRAASQIETIIVTAQKREENAQDVPMMITPLNSEALAKIGFANMTSLGDKVSSLDIQPYYHASSTLKIYMRGVGQEEPEQIMRDQGVGVYLDDVYVAHGNTLAADLGDVERIEVLHGPQGTLYGRNTIGGAIKFISAKPTGKFGIKESLDYGNYNLLRSVTNLNLPEIANVSSKFTFLKSLQDGWVTIPESSDTFGDKDQTGARAAFRWKPIDALSVDYVFDYTHQKNTSGYLQHQYDAVPFGYSFPVFDGRQDTAWRPVQFPLHDDFSASGHSLTVDWDIGDATTFKSITAFRKFDADTANDGMESFNLPYGESSDTKLDQFSQELLLSGTGATGRVKYHLGLFYFREDGDQRFDAVPFGYGADSIYAGDVNPYVGPTENDTVLYALSSVRNESAAVYGNITWTPPVLDDRLTLDIGARQSWDTRHADVTDGPYLTFGDNLTYDPARASYSSFDPSATIDFSWTDSVHTYARISKAYRAGGFNLFDYTFVSNELSSFDPEHLLAYEVGIKSTSWDNRLRINLAAFYEKYDDIQIGFYSPEFLLFTTANAGDATIKGVEGDIEVIPVEGLRLNAAFARLDSDGDIVDPFTQIPTSGQLPNIPKWKYNVSAEYTLPPSRFGIASAQISYAYHDKQVASSASLQGDFRPSYELVDARLTLSDIPVSRGKLSLALWGKNLADEAYQVYHNYNAVMFGQPLSYGMNVTYDF